MSNLQDRISRAKERIKMKQENKDPDIMGRPSWESIASEDPSAAKDVVTTFPQNFTLEYGDEIISQFNPEMGDSYRQAVEEARERSPYATTVGELLAPDVVSLFFPASKFGKFRKMGQVAEDVTTAGIMAKGRNEEFTAGDAAATAGIGRAMRFVPEKLGKDWKKVKASQMGMKGRFRDFGEMSNRGEFADEAMDELVTSLDNMGFEKMGAVDFDPKDLTFKTKGFKSGTGTPISPPAPKELWGRAKQGKDVINKQVDDILSKNTVEPFEFLDETKELDEMIKRVDRRLKTAEKKATVGDQITGQTPLYKRLQAEKEDLLQKRADAKEIPSRSGTRGIFNVEDIQEKIHSDLGDISSLTPTEANKLNTELNGMMETIFGDVRGEANVNDLIAMKRKLYDRIDFLKEQDPISISLRKKVARSLNSLVEDALPESQKKRMRELNKAWGDLAEVQTSIKNKVDIDAGVSDNIDPSVFAVNPKYGAGRLAADMYEDIATPFAELSKTMQRREGEGVLKAAPRSILREMMRAVPRKGASELVVGDEGSNPSRQPQSSSVMPASERLSINMPKELMKVKIPRTTEGMKEYSQLFKLKVAQEADNIVREKMFKAGIDVETIDPMEITRAATELYKNVDTVIEEHPEDLPSMLPVWIQQYPSMFEKDRYNRVDGVVPQSMRPMVRDEIRKNPNISNVERIKQLDLLNRSGEYKDQ